MRGVSIWSKNAGDNASADNTVNWAEGQAPSSVNDSSRAEMASVACWRDDISGTILTTGTSQAYALSSAQNFDTRAHLDGQMIAFVPHVTSAAGPVTMTVDAMPNIPLRSSPNAELPAGVLIQGTPYVAVFNAADGALYLRGFYGNPYNIPLAAGLDYWGTSTPNSAFAFPTGQAISRTTYAALFAIMGTSYGVGDGSTTFNLPDKSERVSVMRSNGAGRLSPTYFGANSGVMGAVGGGESNSIGQANLPNVNFTVVDNGHQHAYSGGTTGGLGSAAPAGGQTVLLAPFNAVGTGAVFSTTINPAGILVNSGGSGTPIRTVPPTIICNYIMRII